jgi:dienelactone hydrolase
MAERLRHAGFAVVLVDYLSAEGVLNACGGKITVETIAKYITESVALVREKSFVDTSRIHIIGWSMGGRGLLEWLQARTAASSSVRSVVAVYAGCAAANPWNGLIPTLMLLGGADDLAPASVCQDLVARLPDGHQVSVRVYPDGRHGFDIEGAPPILEIGGGQTLGYHEEAAREAWHDVVTFLVPVE